MCILCSVRCDNAIEEEQVTFFVDSSLAIKVTITNIKIMLVNCLMTIVLNCVLHSVNLSIPDEEIFVIYSFECCLYIYY